MRKLRFVLPLMALVVLSACSKTTTIEERRTPYGPKVDVSERWQLPNPVDLLGEILNWWDGVLVDSSRPGDRLFAWFLIISAAGWWIGRIARDLDGECRECLGGGGDCSMCGGTGRR